MNTTANTTQAEFEAAQVAKRARAALKYANMSSKYAFADNERFVGVTLNKHAAVHVRVLATGNYKPITINTPIDVR